MTKRIEKELSLDLGNDVNLKLRLIPAGNFLMGNLETDEGREKDDFQHEVMISKPFYIGMTPVTVNQFASFVAGTGYTTLAEHIGWSRAVVINDGKLDSNFVDGCSWRRPSFEQTGDHPVVQVSRDDAKAFCDWLSKENGLTVVLPTEAQWEYACRAGSTTRFGFGDDDKELGSYAWYSENSGWKTHPVGQKKPNPWGLYDMHGNVWEWCQDAHGNYPNHAVTDPPGANPMNGYPYVMRGGCWYNAPGDCQSARRSWDDTDSHGCLVGFRVAALVAGMD